MAVDERSRIELQNRLEQVLGEAPAMTLMESLPRGSPATKDDIDELRHTMDERFVGVDRRFDGMDERSDGIDQRLDGVDQRLEGIDHRLDGLGGRLDGVELRLESIDLRFGVMDERMGLLSERIDSRTQSVADQLTVSLHRDIVVQSRLYMFATFGAIVGVAGVVAAVS
jgi:hypothetical protein